MNHKQTHRQNGLAAANGEAVEEGRIVNFRLLWLVVQSLSCVGLFRDPMDCSPPGSSVHGIFQASILDWAIISFSRVSSQTRDQTCISCISKQIL